MGHVTSLFARKMVAAAGESIDASALLVSAALDPDGQWDPKVMIPATIYYDMLERIAGQVEVIDLPLLCGASMRCYVGSGDPRCAWAELPLPNQTRQQE